MTSAQHPGPVGTSPRAGGRQAPAHEPPAGGLGRTLHRLRRRLCRLAVVGWFLPSHDRDPYAALRQGVLASVLVVIGSLGVGWMPSVPESFLARVRSFQLVRLDLSTALPFALVLAVGCLLLVRSWLRLGQQVSGCWATHGIAVRRAVWWWTVPLLVCVPIFSRDVFSYIQQGRMVAAGLDPYAEGVSQLPGWFMYGADSIWAESPSPYGPLFLGMGEAIWRLSAGIPDVAVLLFRTIAVAGLALCLWAVPRLAEAAGRNPDWAVWLVVANPLFLLYMVAGVHNDALMIGLMLAGFVLLVREPRRRLPALAGILLIVLSVAIKPLTALVLPFAALLLPAGWRPFRDGTGLSLRRRIGPWLTTGAAALAVLAAIGAATGLGFGWVQAMLTSGDAAFPYAPFGLLGLGFGALVDVVTAVPARQAAGWFYTAGTAATLAYTAWCALRPRAADPIATSASVLLVAIVLAPIVQPWYLLWVLPLAACALPGRNNHPRWLGWVNIALVLALTAVGAVDQLAVANWVPLTVVRLCTAVLCLAMIVWLVWLDPHTRRLFPGRRRQAELIEPEAEPTPAHRAADVVRLAPAIASNRTDSGPASRPLPRSPQ
ncbi:polyprenol phosphomannose-dependent alpha 1,6 mannosyltransferase MptB [Micrococcus lylae]|uniref:polyprenol phosphomannose-dependent alpha 1,6 mannosyltransferase MptB n=1 Tax=Micrococcus lylae TaxID=1273 RepID=UPI000B357A28|nr:polyprenol phosphomannose-dependent alpha 1,6 mannosyltransferase MptB [Micrococcus lylae]